MDHFPPCEIQKRRKETVGETAVNAVCRSVPTVNRLTMPLYRSESRRVTNAAWRIVFSAELLRHCDCLMQKTSAFPCSGQDKRDQILLGNSHPFRETLLLIAFFKMQRKYLIENIPYFQEQRAQS